MYRTLSLTVMSVLLSAFLVAPSVQAGIAPPPPTGPGEPFFCKCPAPMGLVIVAQFCLERGDPGARAMARSDCDGFCSGHGVVIPCNPHRGESCNFCGGIGNSCN